ncbi:RsmB/NOP family class I SAM-dependent RNA methyltransferase [Maritimibacter alexandrii]|uniref:RsmB/NOP family class I SAM-dependent RNA methyltransferase n=1 Tax=Maritimibacter alexandrii TaxID=2570355 RepID=UPI001108C40E|nr:RsmB/NOP family class I SAM-dependent RNA methyltransferase [Maritimibacter alexandrii]
MTPAARLSAAIEILDDWLAGAAPEQVLTRWGRANRYAGSKDRAAIRDIVYDAVRCRRSFATLGGGVTGRGLVLGGLRAAGADPDELFTGDRFAPTPLADEERTVPDLANVAPAVRLDLPDWVLPLMQDSLGADCEAVAQTLRHRAPVFLRVNTAKVSRAGAQAALADEGIGTTEHTLSDTALEVTSGARRVHISRAYQDGLVELQDAASQAVIDLLDVTPGVRVLDYCAGGGGKALALAAQGAAVTAHDIDAGRMRDLPERARRAGADIDISAPGQSGDGFDLVFADAPCSGSGSWRRAPQGKWSLTRDGLDALCRIQATILDEIADRVRPGGRIAYATCSLFDEENMSQIKAFVARRPEWTLTASRRFTPLDGGDGFFVAILETSPGTR